MGSFRIYGSDLTVSRCVSVIHPGGCQEKGLAGECLARVSPTLVSTCYSVLPGFAPAGEVLLLGQKAPKPVTPRLATWERTDASLRRADPLAESILSYVEGLKQGQPADESVPPLSQTAGVGPRETNLSRTHMKEGDPYILYDPQRHHLF